MADKVETIMQLYSVFKFAAVFLLFVDELPYKTYILIFLRNNCVSFGRFFDPTALFAQILISPDL